MTLTVRFFAGIREAVGTSQLALDSSAATVAALRDELIARGGPWAEALARGKAVRASVNQVMVDETAPLAAGSEVAFFPPVTGG
jgi:sulfur-carrier protein